MSSFSSFEEIEVWQKARSLADKIYKVTQSGGFARDFELKDQINAASGSIMDNIAEGFERDGVREFIQFLSIAKGSAGEVRSQLYRALDRNHIDQPTFQELKEHVLSVSKQLSGLMSYLNKSGYKGQKFVREHDEDYTNPNEN